MILLDSDHVTILTYPESEQGRRLRARIAASDDPKFATTIVTVEEQVRGWLAQIRRPRQTRQQVRPYGNLLSLIEFLKQFIVIGFDDSAADEFDRLRRAKIRIGSSDLKIASIARVHNVLLLSANLRDFRQVPGLRVENWLTE